MAPKPVTTQVSNQATPYAQDFLQHLMGSLSSGYATPLQRNIGSAFESYIGQGPQFFDVSPQFDAMTALFNERNTQGMSDIRESMSIGGSRYGTAAGVGQGRFLAQAIPAQNALLGQIAQRSFEFGHGNYLSALNAGGDFSINSFAPFVAMAQAGIVNPAVNMQENPWVTGINTAGNVAGAVLPFFDRQPSGTTTGVMAHSPPVTYGGYQQSGGYGQHGPAFTDPYGELPPGYILK